MNTGWLSCTSSTVMANKACLVVLLVYVRETLIFVRLQMVSFCLFFFVFSFVCLFVFLTEKLQSNDWECLTVVYVVRDGIKLFGVSAMRKGADKTPLNLKMMQQVKYKPFIAR